MDGDLREQTCFRFYQVMAKKLPSLSRNELEEGLSSLKCNSPQVRLSGFWNLESFCFWNRKSWALETGIQHKESGIPLTIGIGDPSSTDKESGIQNLESRVQNTRLSWIFYKGQKGDTGRDHQNNLTENTSFNIKRIEAFIYRDVTQHFAMKYLTLLTFSCGTL